ncbi:MAG: DUF885 domain-containing protein [Myxococcota bacterium]
MRRVLLGLGAVLGVGFLAAAIFVVNLLWFKPIFINHFFERTFLRFAIDNPELLTTSRALKPLGLKFYHDDLADLSDAQELRSLEQLQSAAQTLASYDDESLTPETLLSKKILSAFLEPQLALMEFRHHDYPINQFSSYPDNWPSFMTDQHWVEDEADAEAYLSRLEKLPTALEQLQEGVALRAEKGVTPPTFVVDKVMNNLRSFTSTPAEANIVVLRFVEKLHEAELPVEAYRERAVAAVKSHVYPAYDGLLAFLGEFRARTDTRDGVWKLPDGERYYDLKLWQQTTTKISAKELHDRGLSEVDRIQGQVLDILEAEGYPTEGGFTAAMAALSADPRQYYAEDEREEILERYRAIIAEAEGKLDPWFNRRHEATVEVKRVPVFREPTAPGAYYQPPALDGSRPGRFYANLYDLKATPKWGMRTLAYHEAVPGHHLQSAGAAELRGLPTFRRILPFTAYSEGWALYAERLAWEMELETAPLDNLGRLQAELFRAVRLVVDTGIHRFRWSREEAIEYMKTNLGSAESDVVSEIERYIVNPGQACAYKVGLDFMLAERQRAMDALGEAFDLRDFHDAVLENGSVPLSILSEQIDAYIARTKKSESLSRKSLPPSRFPFHGVPVDSTFEISKPAR